MTHHPPPPPPPVSPELEQALCSGDVNRVITVAWPMFHRGLERLALKSGTSHDDVDDFMIEVYEDVLEGWAGFTGVGFQPWLFTLAFYVAQASLQRRLRNRVFTTLEADGCFTPDVEAMIDDRRAVGIIDEVTAQLSEADQRLVWAQARGETDAEIASCLSAEYGKTYNAHAVTMRWLRIRTTFAKVLARRRRQ